MSNKFKEQGGAATMDPSKLRRWITSRLFTKVTSQKYQTAKQSKAEQTRLKNNNKHVLEYFHQIEDAYSYLSAQTLKTISDSYDVEIKCYLVNGPQGKNSPEPDLLLQLAAYDSNQIAKHYGLTFPSVYDKPTKAQILLANSILANQSSNNMMNYINKVSEAVWTNNKDDLEKLAHKNGKADLEKTKSVLEFGSARQKQLKHYSGGMFYYGDEWYWGVDRLYHLEKRFIDLGLNKLNNANLKYPRPDLDLSFDPIFKELTFEIYPSLRSPYTALIFDTAVDFAKSKGLDLCIKPVLPMVMRGVPATREKGIYIFSDAAREARTIGNPFGKIYDPIGQPAKDCYALYSWAFDQNRHIELISSFLKHAFKHGTNINNKKGFKKVVLDAGLNWEDANKELHNDEWHSILEANRQELYSAGLWGVPSFRLLDSNKNVLLSLWGQDRLWVFSKFLQQYKLNHES